MLKMIWLVAVLCVVLVVSEPLSARCRHFGGGGRFCRWRYQAASCQPQCGAPAFDISSAPSCLPPTCAAMNCPPTAINGSCVMPPTIGCTPTPASTDTRILETTPGLAPPIETTEAPKPHTPVSPDEQAMWDQMIEKKLVEKGDYEAAWVKASSEDRKMLYDALMSIVKGTNR